MAALRIVELAGSDEHDRIVALGNIDVAANAPDMRAIHEYEAWRQFTLSFNPKDMLGL